MNVDEAAAYECRCDLSHGRRHSDECEQAWNVLTEGERPR